MGVAFVRGIQGDDPNVLRCVATPKHFAVHSGPEPLRPRVRRAGPGAGRVRDLPAAVRDVRAGRPGAVDDGGRTAPFKRRARDGQPVVADGSVAGDVGGSMGRWCRTSTRSTTSGRGTTPAKDAAEASAMALKAGDDLCSGDTYRALPEAMRRGLVTEGDLDRAATRLFTLRYRLGTFDDNPYRHIPASEIDSPRARRAEPGDGGEVARAAEERRGSAVLFGGAEGSGDRADGRRSGDADRQLQRRTLASGHDFGGAPEEIGGRLAPPPLLSPRRAGSRGLRQRMCLGGGAGRRVRAAPQGIAFRGRRPEDAGAVATRVRPGGTWVRARRRAPSYRA